jgi:hypothetical protein
MIPSLGFLNRIKQEKGGNASLFLLKIESMNLQRADYIKGILQTVAFSNLPRTSTKISEPAAANSLFT